MRRVALALLILAVAPASATGQAADGSFTGDRVVITGPVTIDRGETADDVVVIDGPVSVAGRVRGDLVVVNGRLRISGTVDGDVVTVADRAALAPGARVSGDFVYGDKRPLVASGATIEGDVDRVSVGEVTDPVGFIGAAALWIAVSVSTLVLGLLLLWLAPRALDAAYGAASTSPGATIGWGLLLFFGLPILAVLALVTLVGIPLGVALLLALLPLYAIGYTTSAWLLGRRLVGPPRGRVLRLSRRAGHPARTRTHPDPRGDRVVRRHGGRARRTAGRHLARAAVRAAAPPTSAAAEDLDLLGLVLGVTQGSGIAQGGQALELGQAHLNHVGPLGGASPVVAAGAVASWPEGSLPLLHRLLGNLHRLLNLFVEISAEAGAAQIDHLWLAGRGDRRALAHDLVDGLDLVPLDVDPLLVLAVDHHGQGFARLRVLDLA